MPQLRVYEEAKDYPEHADELFNMLLDPTTFAADPFPVAEWKRFFTAYQTAKESGTLDAFVHNLAPGSAIQRHTFAQVINEQNQIEDRLVHDPETPDHYLGQFGLGAGGLISSVFLFLADWFGHHLSVFPQADDRREPGGRRQIDPVQGPQLHESDIADPDRPRAVRQPVSRFRADEPDLPLGAGPSAPSRDARGLQPEQLPARPIGHSGSLQPAPGLHAKISHPSGTTPRRANNSGTDTCSPRRCHCRKRSPSAPAAIPLFRPDVYLLAVQPCRTARRPPSKSICPSGARSPSNVATDQSFAIDLVREVRRLMAPVEQGLESLRGVLGDSWPPSAGRSRPRASPFRRSKA